MARKPKAIEPDDGEDELMLGAVDVRESEALPSRVPHGPAIIGGDDALSRRNQAVYGSRVPLMFLDRGGFLAGPGVTGRPFAPCPEPAKLDALRADFPEYPFELYADGSTTTGPTRIEDNVWNFRGLFMTAEAAEAYAGRVGFPRYYVKARA